MNFNQIPNNILTPIVAVEFDNTNAISGPQSAVFKALMIGNRLDAGTIAEAVPKRVSSAEQAAGYWGRGSIIHKQFEAWFKNNKSIEVWGVALDDDGNAASAQVEFTGTASEAGTIAMYFGGERVPITVAAGDDGEDIADALKAKLALIAYQNLPINFGGSGATVDIAMKNEGEFGDEYDIRASYFDTDKIPAGISVNVTPMDDGSGNPDVLTALTALGDDQFKMISMPYTDTSNLDAMRDFLLERWGPMTQNDGFVVTMKSADDSELGTMGDARNNFLENVFGYKGSPTQPWGLAAGIAGQMAAALEIDPARPVQTLRVVGALAASSGDRFTQQVRNNLLTDGIATLKETADGGLAIERAVTTYKTNAADGLDPSYRDIETIFTLSEIRFDWRNYIALKYPRSKLADDGTRFGPGQAIVTPSLIKAEAILKFTEWELNGWVEGFSQFKNDIIVERNASDKNRLDVLLPPDLVNQLRVVGTQIQFLL